MKQEADKNEVLDELDRDILGELSRDARISFTDLAQKVNLSANAAADRVRRLVKSGVIAGFRTEIAPSALGHALHAYIDVKLRADTPAEDFEAAVERIPGVLQMTLTTGSFDYTIRVGVRDQAGLVALIETLRKAVPIAESYSRIVLRERTIFRAIERARKR